MTEDDSVRIRLLHTSDWHLGFSFRALGDADQRLTLAQQRLHTVEHVLGLAATWRVEAVLCAGDVFDERSVDERWWRGLVDLLRAMPHPCPVVLLPGENDFLHDDGVWGAGHPLRTALPDHVHIADRAGWTLDVGDALRIYAAPVGATAAPDDPVGALPARSPDDPPFRVALAHGALAAAGKPGHDGTIAAASGRARGFDYVALGHRHGFAEVAPADPETRFGLTVYSGTPEPMRFGEEASGSATLVQLRDDGAPSLRHERVGRWKWRTARCACPDDVAVLLDADDLISTVLRLELDMAVSVAERERVDSLVAELAGTPTERGRAGFVERVDETRLHFAPDAFDAALPGDVPPTLRAVHRRLREQLPDAPSLERARIERALLQLTRLVAEQAR